MGNPVLSLGSGPCHLCKNFQGWADHLDRQIPKCAIAFYFYGNPETGCKLFERQPGADDEEPEPGAIPV